MTIPRFLVLLGLLAAISATVEAALIFGTITVGEAPLAHHEVAVSCGNVRHPTNTDERGSYAVKPEGKGPCNLSLTYDAQPLSYPVYSQDNPARYDLVLERGNDGRWTLRRR